MIEKPSHKFFEKMLSNDLEALTIFLSEKMSQLSEGKVPNVTQEQYDRLKGDAVATKLGQHYNIFQFHNKEIHNLYSALSEMTKEACEYYGIDFKSENYMIQGWFNFDKYKKPEPLPDRYLHDHMDGKGAPDFHGYYCVNAEPSNTYYKIGGMDGERFANVNRNNRAILSETGHPHGIQSWEREDFRITIAYDVVPLNEIRLSPEQHWIPLT
jgi:hypothetical protein